MMTNRKSLPRRGIYILPSALTTGNLFCGFYAITCIWAGYLDRVNGKEEQFLNNLDQAAIAIGIAIVLDALDGRIARMTGATSQFGLQLDSLADAISFGIAPALMLWGWALSDIKHFGWIVCFLFMICGIMRLARFNTQTSGTNHFLGLPIPAAAGMIASFAHFSVKYINMKWLHSEFFPYALMVMSSVLAMLMISTVRYGSFKGISFKNGRSQVNVVLIALFFAGIWFFSHEILLVLSLVYFFSGLVSTARRKFFPRTASNENSADQDTAYESDS